MSLTARVLLFCTLPLLVTSFAVTGASQDEADPPGQVAVTRSGLVASLLQGLAAAESEGAWLGGDRPVADARILLAFLSDGHSVRQGDHQECLRRAGTRFLKRFSRELGSPFETGPENDLAHALALTTVAEFWIADNAKGAIARTRAAAAATIKRQDENGVWGAGNDQPLVTARMVLGLCIARSAGMDIADERFEDTFRTMDSWMDAETGAAKKQGGMTEEDVLARTAALVTARLVAGQDPDSDALLGKSVAWLSERLGSPEVAKRWGKATADPTFWEWTTHATVQLFGPGEELSSWSIAATQGMSRDALALIQEKVPFLPERAARIVRAVTAVFRFAPGEFAPGND